MESTKRCCVCKETKPISDFHKDQGHKDGRSCLCKKCSTLYAKQYYQQHKTELKKQAKQYHQNHRAEIKKHKKQYYKTIKGYLKQIWHHMLHRCNNPKNKRYKNYGGRGIKVCFASFDHFFDYVVNKLKADPRGLTIDRIDNDGNYEPGNIRFVSRSENNKNKRRKYYESAS